jgi:hypothetical protein
MAGVCVNMIQIAVAATAVSRQRALIVELSTDGYFTGMRLLNAAVRQGDSQTLEDRVKSVAHDWYLAGLGATDGSYPTTDSAAAAELELDFWEVRT